VAAGSSLALLGAAVARQPRAPRETRGKSRAVSDSGRRTAAGESRLTRRPGKRHPSTTIRSISRRFNNLDRVIEPRPAWLLVETSPDAATSWLGGMPCAPAAFEWPLSGTGRPMLFVAQIDLAGVSAQGLPNEGALLFFIDALPNVGLVYQVRTLSNDDLAASAPISPPSGAVTPPRSAGSNPTPCSSHTPVPPRSLHRCRFQQRGLEAVRRRGAGRLRLRLS
jgi:hypothetical protein